MTVDFKDLQQFCPNRKKEKCGLYIHRMCLEGNCPMNADLKNDKIKHHGPDCECSDCAGQSEM